MLYTIKNTFNQKDLFMKKLDLSNNIAFFRGAVAPFVRMNQELLDFYRATESWTIRAKCATGVLAVFETDSAALQINVEFGEPARPIFTTDVEVNGKVTTFDGAGTHSMQLPAGSKVVTVHLPHLAVLTRFEIEVDDNARVAAIEDNRPKLLICGDSILQGMTCSSPSRASAAITARELNMQLHNTSVGGAKMEFAPVAATLQLGGKDDTIVVGFGANDTAQKVDLDYFRSSTGKILAALNDFPGKSLIIAPIPTTNEFGPLLPTYSNIIREEHAKFPRVKLLDGYSFYPCQAELFVDGLHPNDEGMKIYAAGLLKALKEF